jgi:hypothetical protein
MAKARKTKPRDFEHLWRATLIKGTPARYLGHVQAKDEAAKKSECQTIYATGSR